MSAAAARAAAVTSTRRSGCRCCGGCGCMRGASAGEDAEACSERAPNDDGDASEAVVLSGDDDRGGGEAAAAAEIGGGKGARNCRSNTAPDSASVCAGAGELDNAALEGESASVASRLRRSPRRARRARSPSSGAAAFSESRRTTVAAAAPGGGGSGDALAAAAAAVVATASYDSRRCREALACGRTIVDREFRDAKCAKMPGKCVRVKGFYERPSASIPFVDTAALDSVGSAR